MAMKDNVFYQNRKAIEKICNESHCDVSTATRMWAHRNGQDNNRHAMNEWDQECIKYMRDPKLTLADLFK